MAELGQIRKYIYWSHRRITEIAESNNIALTQSLAFTVTAALPGVQAGATKEPRELMRHEIAEKIEEAIGQLAVEDFVTPPPAQFAKGVGHVEFARDALNAGPEMGAVMHVQAMSSDNSRVHVCLFGSMENFIGYIRDADFKAQGWSSSEFVAIRELIISHGEAKPRYGDDEALAVNALGLVQRQGITGTYAEHEGKPWTRGYTVGSADEAEWMVEVYKDVELTKERWRDLDADRIVIGAPLWIRTPTSRPVQLYQARTKPRFRNR